MEKSYVEIETFTQCPVCRTSVKNVDNISFSYIEIDGKRYYYTIDICRYCGAIYSVKRSKNQYLYTEKYDAEKEHGHQKEQITPIPSSCAWNSETKRLQAEEIVSFIKKSSFAYLEVGSSDGTLFQIVKQCVQEAGRLFAKALLIESSGASNYCSNIERCQVVKQPILSEDLLLASNTYDIAVLSHCLEHFEKPRDVIKKIRKTLSYNGILYIEIPDGMRCDRSISYPLGYFHVVNYNLLNLSWMIRSEGFEIIDLIQRDHYPGIRLIAKKSCLSTIDEPLKESYYWGKGALNQWLNVVNKIKQKINKLNIKEQQKKVLLYGCGTHTRALVDAFPYLSLLCDFTDSNPRIKSFDDKPVIPVDMIDFKTYDHIIISSYAYQDDIYKRIILTGCPPEKTVRLYDTIFSYG
ncbi:MAG: methyltransferase domain-containing protein [Clostridia bacterium]|nr:methyltransferase domain-containing protein [Clostridia bacterium]